jgi:heptaprenyl diphosphate synthase
MQSVNKTPMAARQQIARLAALTLIFSYAELMLPRVVPFFRLGLGNAALLMGLALGLTFPAFMLLAVVKAVAANLMAGTLFSPFFLVSLAQSFTSALIMFGLWRAGHAGREGDGRRLLSLYGISVCGAAASALVQIALSSLYLGQGTWSLLGPMLLFNLISGFITAWIAEILGASDTGGGSLPLARTSLLATPSSGGRPRNAPDDIPGSHPLPRIRNLFCLAILLAAAASVFFIKNTAVLCVILLLSFLAQKISGRKIFLLPHLSLWVFVLITYVFVPNGRVLFTFAGFSFTEGAALSALQKALRLSIVSALSQTAATIKLNTSPDSLLTLTLAYYSAMSDTFRNTPGSVITKIKAALR